MVELQLYVYVIMKCTEMASYGKTNTYYPHYLSENLTINSVQFLHIKWTSAEPIAEYNI